MDKIDFKKTYKQWYSPKPNKPEIVDVPTMQFAMVDGSGSPDDQQFQDAVGALYSVVYGIKFGRKKTGVEPDYGVGPLEGLWWNTGDKKFEKGEKKDWLWTVMIWLPDQITRKVFDDYVAQIKIKKPNPALDSIRIGSIQEGKVVQIMHIGPYADEKRSVDLMHIYAKEKGFTQSGKHHEIYLSDPRRVAPEKMRTIVRHPISKN